MTAHTFTFTSGPEGSGLAQVSGLAASNVTQTTLTLSWTAVANALDYLVERSPTGSGSWTSRGTPTGTSHAESGLTASTSYYYRVTARNATQTGSASATLGVTTLASQPPASGFTRETGFDLLGTLADGQSVTITDTLSRFGTKANVKPLMWMPCETNLLPHPALSRVTTPLTAAPNTVYQTATKPVNATGALRARPLASTTDRSAWTTEPQFSFSTGECYCYVKKRFDFAAHPDNVKSFRLWPASAGTPPSGFYAHSAASGVLGHFEQWSWNDAVSTGSHYCHNRVFLTNQWEVDEYEFKEGSLGNLDGIFCHWLNALTAHTYAARFKTRDSTYPGAKQTAYLDEFTNTPPNGTASYYLYYHSIYFDDSRHRVFVSDEPSFSTAQYGSGTTYNREVCIPTAWSAGSVTVVLRQGSHSALSGKYLYVVKSDGSALKIGRFV